MYFLVIILSLRALKVHLVTQSSSPWSCLSIFKYCLNEGLITLSLSGDKIFDWRTIYHYSVSNLKLLTKIMTLIQCGLNFLQLILVTLVLFYLALKPQFDLGVELLIVGYRQTVIMNSRNPWLMFLNHLIDVLKVTLLLDLLHIKRYLFNFLLKS